MHPAVEHRLRIDGKVSPIADGLSLRAPADCDGTTISHCLSDTADGGGHGEDGPPSARTAEPALAFVDYLLGEEAQTYFAEETREYPLIAGVPTAAGLKPLAEVGSPAIDLSDLADLQGTIALLTEVGVL